MSIRVGRRVYSGATHTDPKIPGYKPILVLTKSSKYGSIGPYVLADEEGRIMENIWQFSKVYENVPNSVRRESRFNNRIIWNHPAQVHVKDGELTPEYWEWRHKGMHNPDPVRYPVGFNHRGKCLYALHESSDEKLDYIEARKQIYLPVYCDLVRGQRQYEELLQRLRVGEKLLIIEVDGPHQEDLDYYIEKYNVAKNFIVNNTIKATRENMDIMLNDPKHPFGHGYCLALALLDDLQ